MIPRYESPEMADIWSDETKFTIWAEIEAIAAYVMEGRQIIPNGVAQEVFRAKGQCLITECKEEEKITQHDVVAFLNVLERKVGPLGRFIHYGMTSSDLVDTGFAIQIRRAIKEVHGILYDLSQEVKISANKYRYTPIMGRTHGMYAEPTTFGLVLLGFHAELERQLKRLEEVVTHISVGKLSGAVGNYAHIPPEVEECVMGDLELDVDPISTQIIGRDRHADVIVVLAMIGTAIERIALQFRLLSRSDVGEVAEGHDKGYVGSSAMPHKQNPIGCENLCGLARVLRGYVVPVMENMILWHERDISHSSAERIIFPDAFSLVHFMIKRMTGIVKNLYVNKEAMKNRVMYASQQWSSQAILLNLIKNGMSRQEAHSLVKNDHTAASTMLKPSVLDSITLNSYLRNVDEIFKRFNL